MPESENDPTQRVIECQRLFWQALQSKDEVLLAGVLADDFVCHSPNQAPQARAAFIATIAAMPIAVEDVAAEQLAIRVFGDIAVLTGVQVAQFRLPDGSLAQERLALTNIFRFAGERWRMVLAHPVALIDQASG
jgi:ketosteroid isomerase-like protein